MSVPFHFPVCEITSMLVHCKGDACTERHRSSYIGAKQKSLLCSSVISSSVAFVYSWRNCFIMVFFLFFCFFFFPLPHISVLGEKIISLVAVCALREQTYPWLIVRLTDTKGVRLLKMICTEFLSLGLCASHPFQFFLAKEWMYF